MPTEKQLDDKIETEINHPWTRHPDDPMYVSPEKYNKMEKDKIQNSGGNGEQKMSAEQLSKLKMYNRPLLQFLTFDQIEILHREIMQFTASAPSQEVARSNSSDAIEDLELAKHCLENDDWDCEQCGYDRGMEDTDAYNFLNKGLKKLQSKQPKVSASAPSGGISKDDLADKIFDKLDKSLGLSLDGAHQKIINEVIEEFLATLSKGEVEQKEEPSQQQIDDEAYRLYPDEETGYRIASNLRAAFENGAEYYRLQTHPADQGKEEQK